MPRQVDRSSPLPLWSQVADDLRERLAAGELADHFPGDAELVEQYGVSRHTAREAVRRLQEDGLVVRERGRGSRVPDRGLEQPLGALYSLYRSIESQGFTQRSEVRALAERRGDPAAEEAAAVLGLRRGSALVYLERVRFADERPVAVDCSWLPATVARPLLTVDFARTALYDELRSRCGARPVSGWERLRPEMPTPEQRRLLQLGARDPVFAIERVTEGTAGPLEWRHSAVRGDGFAFVARWSDRDPSPPGALEAVPD